jgi:malonate-semialdehyde dehydrogenase (acetylating)/methylmalonate-semialdehyde dehydrogenase
MAEIKDPVDSEMFRQPLGVVVGLTPFNFPVMVPLWMIPIAVACGNTFILKPSERTPLAAVRLAELLPSAARRPARSMVHGAAATAERLIS